MSEFFVYDNEKSDCEDYSDDYKNVNITYNTEKFKDKSSKLDLKIKHNTNKDLDNEKSNIDIDNKKINNINVNFVANL